MSFRFELRRNNLYFSIFNQQRGTARLSRIVTKQAQESHVKKQTYKRTRKFVLDGVQMETTSVKIIYGCNDESYPGTIDDQEIRYMLLILLTYY